MNVEMETFAPLIVGTNGGMGVDRQNFVITLAENISRKNNANVTSRLRIQLSFGGLRITHKCGRGARITVKPREVLEDFTFASHIVGPFHS